MAAATKNDERNDDDPTAVITKQITKTIIHIKSSLQALGRVIVLSRYHRMKKNEKGVKNIYISSKRVAICL